MGIKKGFTFGGVESLDYNVGITGEAVYNAPRRDVEMISIPGRNGEYALDKKRFHNIEVTYPAGAYDSTQPNFASKLSDFRNSLASKIGYQRLEDEYNLDEYRMAIYKSGLDVSPVQYSRAGEFDIIFDCKPQRWLKSGETAVTCTSGMTLANPTLFASKPMVLARGSGTISFNGYDIELDPGYLGDVVLLPSFGGNPSYSKSYATGLVNSGDPITVASGSEIIVSVKTTGIEVIDVMVTNSDGKVSVSSSSNLTSFTIRMVFPAQSFTAGTSKTVSSSVSAILSYREGAGPEVFETITFTPTIAYTASTRTFAISCPHSTRPAYVSSLSKPCTCQQVTADSTVSGLGDPTYIDCETGEAYKVSSNQYISLNNLVAIGSALPELAPGNNTITFDNTITNLQIIPRWWRV